MQRDAIFLRSTGKYDLIFGFNLRKTRYIQVSSYLTRLHGVERKGHHVFNIVIAQNMTYFLCLQSFKLDLESIIHSSLLQFFNGETTEIRLLDDINHFLLLLRRVLLSPFREHTPVSYIDTL